MGEMFKSCVYSTLYLCANTFAINTNYLASCFAFNMFNPLSQATYVCNHAFFSLGVLLYTAAQQFEIKLVIHIVVTNCFIMRCINAVYY